MSCDKQQYFLQFPSERETSVYFYETRQVNQKGEVLVGPWPLPLSLTLVRECNCNIIIK